MKNTVTLRSASKTDDSGKEITIRVRKITNGYILSKEVYDPKAKDDKNRWKSTEEFHDKNPLDFNEKKSLVEIFS